MKKKLIYCMLPLLVLTACSDDKGVVEPEQTPGQETPVEQEQTKLEQLEWLHFTPAQDKVNESLNNLSLDLLGKSAAAMPGENVSVSPVSAAICMGMIANSVDDYTASSIAEALGYGDLSTMNEVCNLLLRYLPYAGNGADLTLANSVWHDNTLPVLDSYVDNIGEIFGAEIFEADFAETSTVDLINSWCADHTNGMIDRIIDEIEVKRSVSWINALYFAGVWETPFDKSLTTTGKFAGIEGDSEVPMMHRKVSGYYRYNENFESINLYFKGETTYLTLYLPREGVTLDGLLADMKSGACKSELAEIDLSLPRFSVESNVELREIIESMGVDFTRMALDPMGIIEDGLLRTIRHKTVMQLDEDGAKAAAVTYGGWATSQEPTEPIKVTMTFDRPFVYTITNRLTESCIMAGYVANL